MKAVILAAGLGSRLGRAPDAHPKILLRFGGRSLLQRHVEILRHLGVQEVVLGLGHQSHLIRKEISALGADGFVRTVDAPDYRLGPLFTIWALRAEFEGPLLFMDGDVLYDQRMVARLLASPHETCLAMDREVRPGEDPVKVCLRDGRVVDFHKRPTEPYDAFGEWIGFIRLSDPVARTVIAAARPYVEARTPDLIYEEAFRDALRALPPGTFAVEDVTGLPWTEIDFPHDLERAEKEILPRLQPLPA